MCDNEINQGIIEDWSLTRRTFVALSAAAGLTSAACAAENVVETDVTVKTPDGQADAALFHPAGKGPWPAVLMWPDIMGLRPVFREMGRRLAAQGYVVLVPNPFYRSATATAVSAGADFSTPEGRQKLFGYRGAMTDEGVDKDSKAYLAFLDAQPQTDKKRKAGVQGYCMGGPLSFRTGAAVANRIGAVATFHGGGLTTDQPNSPHLLIPKMNAAFLICVARNDDARDPKSKDILKAAFAAARKDATVEVYPGDHGWCVPGSQVYDQAAAEKAWAELTKLYKAKLA
ncbi:dienelactone hydrolase family protein [Sphingobium nicotianae]|uniref:Dienelactone hydrolase family protein n=1 Tax=Sphingobium nicotianae TaxID=2782607 RepID=A0A9X1DD92_9SPHN|nr:dienelactone hydrolase family protein [Sphingobium nicotianae]MBT2187779.1 dienelactone hydrolase family protein [Sphingobium nicotianae]